uniref:Uncharacterized protein n=1 Tax=Tanacetum cinerariifolium TaxID=118510 RepID=A0A6L2LYW0_TANCI|nr:hypothetical protein [Tanacetum cinerariifolium]
MSQSNGPNTLVADETIHDERGDRVERAATTAASLDAEQDSGNILRTQSMAAINEPFPLGTSSVKDKAEGMETREEGSSKRAGEELKSDKSKNQKLDAKVKAKEDTD